MARKFLYSKHALIENYSTNQITHMYYSGGGVWTVVDNITAGPTTNNLSSLASNQQGDRVLYANYSGNGVVPLNYNGSTWVPGTLVSSGQPTTATAAVAMSADGLHALSGGDFQSSVTPYEFNVGTGLWVAQTPVPVGHQHLDTVAMSRDGLRAIIVSKYDAAATPMFRNPSTGIWSVGADIAINSSTERFFCAGFSPDGNSVVIGSNQNLVSSDGLTWNGSSWDRVSIPVTLRGACWTLDGKSVIGGNGQVDVGAIRILNFDPITKTFSAGQVLTGYNNVAGVQVANDTVGDVALATDFGANQVIPLQYSRDTGLWSSGTPISSALFNSPWNMLVFPIW